MLSSVNSLSGANRELSGLLNDKAGLINELNNVVKSYLDATSDSKRKQLVSDAKSIASKFSDPTEQKAATYYVKTLERYQQDKEYPKKELDRLSRMINSGASNANMIDEFQVRRNILSQF